MNLLLKKLTVLIVDDAKSNIFILAELLKQDYTIRAASSGEQALRITLSDNPPDLILLDVVLPGIDGYEVCKRLKASDQTARIPIIFITGNRSEEDEITGFNMGAADYIVKPFNPVIVKARVGTQADLKHHHDYLEKISFLDGLTGIKNRRKFDELLEISWNFAKRQSFSISMIMIDIDFFKRFNDHYGHQAGDACLIKIAQLLSNITQRNTDFVARYGGEEFACVLPGANLENAEKLAEKIRLGTMMLQIPHNMSSVAKIVTVSIGVATITPETDSNSCVMIKAADNALYLSKETGRNMVSSVDLSSKKNV